MFSRIYTGEETSVFLKDEKGEKMGKSENMKTDGCIKEIAEILAAGIIRMKKKGKLK